MKPKLIKLIIIPVTKGSQSGMVITIKIIAMISSILSSDKKAHHSSRIICNTQRWNLLGKVGGTPGVVRLLVALHWVHVTQPPSVTILSSDQLVTEPEVDNHSSH